MELFQKEIDKNTKDHTARQPRHGRIQVSWLLCGLTPPIIIAQQHTEDFANSKTSYKCRISIFFSSFFCW
jgi:hypothetical protein